MPDESGNQRPIRPETRARLLLGIAKARRWVDDLVSGRALDTQQLADREHCSERSIRANINLAFLSPTIIKAALEGTLPDGMGVSVLCAAGPEWGSQWRGA